MLDRAAAEIRERRAAGIPDFQVSTPTHQDPRRARVLDRLIVAGLGLSEHIGGVQYFYHDRNCNGCGICERVCLSGKIRLADGTPRWDRGTLCYMCFACLNFCPRRSVQIRSIPFVESRSTENGRYPHPYATAVDMEEQKRPAVDSPGSAR
jgi:ferredoxin